MMVIALKLGFGLYSLVVVTGFLGLITTILKLFIFKKENIS